LFFAEIQTGWARFISQDQDSTPPPPLVAPLPPLRWVVSFDLEIRSIDRSIATLECA
jgi:hypothetical protein